MSEQEKAPEATAPDPTNYPTPPHTIAFVIDGVVRDVIATNDGFAAILLSEPTIAYANGVKEIHDHVGQTKYDAETGVFTHPDGTTEVADKFIYAVE